MGKIKQALKNISQYSGYILFVLIFAGMGVLFGYLSEGVLKDFFETYINNDIFYIQIINIYLILFIFILAYFLHIILHELGHLIFGKLTGYRFVSFRIGSFTIIREEGKFKIKRFRMPGTVGQSLMMPPEKKDGQYPFVAYNLGGVFTNSIVTVITVFMAIYIKELNYTKLIAILTSLAGILVIIINGIPMKIGGVANDGHNVRSMLKDSDARDSFYLQLQVNGLLTEGSRMRNMPYEQFKLEKGIDYSDPINFSKILMSYNYYLDNKKFKKAKEVLDFGMDYVDETIPIYRQEFNSERLFIEIMGDCDKEKIEKLYTKNLEKYIKTSKFMLSKKRIMMAYEGVYRGNRERGLIHFQELKKLAKTYPIKGETRMEIMLGKIIEDRIEARAEAETI